MVVMETPLTHETYGSLSWPYRYLSQRHGEKDRTGICFSAEDQSTDPPLGAKYSPESACLPFKFILGNFIEALEKGADTIAMITDHGPCRVGMYDVVMQQILKDLGFQFNWIAMDNTRIWGNYFLRFDRERKEWGVSVWESLRAIRLSWKRSGSVSPLKKGAKDQASGGEKGRDDQGLWSKV